MLRLLYGSFDYVCAQSLSFKPVFEPIHIAIHLSILIFRPEHASLIVFSSSNSVLCDPSNMKFLSSA